MKIKQMKEMKKKISITDVKKTGTRKKIISKKTIFWIILTILFYLTLLISSQIFINIRAEADKNYAGEVLALFLILIIGIIAYKKTFQKPSKSQIKRNKKALLEKEKLEKLLHEKYVNGQRLLKTTETTKVISGIQNLLDVAIAFPKKRQKIINLIEGKNHWMKDHQKFLISSNLVTWRLRKSLFFDIDADQQTISLEILTAIEKIIKQHVIDFPQQVNPQPLDLTACYIPALNLGFTSFPRKCIIFDYAFCWQTSFWQSEMFDISFKSTDLQGANFWKCKLSGIDFGGAKLKKAKLKTNLMAVNNIAPNQFFLTQEWTVNILGKDKLKIFFPDQSLNSQRWREWKSKQKERDLLLADLTQSKI